MAKDLTVSLENKPGEGARLGEALGNAGVNIEASLPDTVVDTPGQFGKMARALADAGINITLGYMATKSRSVLATSDNARAMEILQQAMM